MGRPINPCRHETPDSTWDTRFQPIFSPREAALKRKITGRRASLRWKQMHPERYEAMKPRKIYLTKLWVANNPEKARAHIKAKVRLLKPWYLRQLIRQHNAHGHNIPITPETIEQKRAEIQALRSRTVLRLIHAAAILTK